MRRASIAAAALVVGVAGAAANGQLTYIGSFGGHDYYRSDAQVTFEHGRTLAADLGQQLGAEAYLAAINCQLEQDWVIATVGPPGPNSPAESNRLWIGFSDETAEGVFVWDSGEPVTYTCWMAGEPNNLLGEEDAGALNWNAAGEWVDLPKNSAAYNIYVRALVEVVPPAPPACCGDCDGDGDCDVFDFCIMTHAFGSTPAHDHWRPGADLVADQHIDIWDFSMLAGNFGCHPE
jgi:hypothetical protein